MKKQHLTLLEINLNAILFNLSYLKSKLDQKTQVIAVVKAFAYGSDSVQVAKSIQKEVAYFAVAYTKEGIALRKAGIQTPILVLHPHPSHLALDIDYNLEPTLYNTWILTAFLAVAKERELIGYPIHLKFNTGLNRLGFGDDEVKTIASLLKGNKTAKVVSVFSHLAVSEDKAERAFTLDQIERFKNSTLDFESQFGYLPLRHMTNTSGVINYPSAHFDLVRLGIGLYGFGNDKKETAQLKNVVSLKSVISQIHHIKKGESVGYNRAFIAQKPVKTATIPIGYADGISRQLGNGVGYFTIHGQKAAIIGNVCMDMVIVNVTDIDCKEGDEVIVFNQQETVLDLAKKSNTITYELITAISQRVQRVCV